MPPGSTQALADAMHGARVEFIRIHRPPWSAWSADGLAMVYDDESGVRSAYALERRIAEELSS